MNEPAAAFLLSSRDGATPPLLERVDLAGRVDGVLFTATLRQSWVNRSPQTLEAIYTFPLPSQALLLSFAAVRADERLEGTILPRAQAEARYEDALERGDAPTLLEVAADGLHTASLGNLAPGEAVVLEIRFAQLLRFENGRLRLVVPTTVAPRYGNPAAAGLAPHQEPLASIVAEYTLALDLTVAGSLASGRLECPTHRHQVERVDGSLRLQLEPGARMDRDVVVVISPAEPRPGLLVSGLDPLAERPRRVALAAFELPRRPSHRPLSVKLLLDCSGSMAGDGIASAQAALRAIAERLGADDEVALVRFGGSTQTALAPARCSSTTLQILRRQIDASTASLGGTDMERSLHATLALPHSFERSDVLLITDGEVWQAGAVAAAARASGQRVFAIGVGSAPAEGALRHIASASGGACEFATPGEDLHAAAVRMVERMRDTPWHDLRLDWGATPRWQEPLPPQAFGGDTVIAMATFDAEARIEARLVGGDEVPASAKGSATGSARRSARGATMACTLASASASEACDPEVLARLLADRERLAESGEQATATAVRYRLLTPHTHCVLVHRRDGDERMEQPARLVRVPSMLAAGWGGTGSVAAASPVLSESAEPAVLHSLRERSASGTAKDVPSNFRFARGEARTAPAAWRSSRSPTPGGKAAAAPALDLLVGLLPAGPVHDALRSWCRAEALPDPFSALLGDLQALGLDTTDAWIMIVRWALAASASGGTTPLLPDWALARLDAIEEPWRRDAGRAIDTALAPGAGNALARRARRLLEALRR